MHPLPPASPFGADDGSVDPALAAALAAHPDPSSAADRAGVLAALLGARLLVPLVGVSGAEPGQPRGAQLASVTVTGRDGRPALPVFTGLGPLARFDAGARPVPMPAPTVARAALAGDVAALLVDPGGPSPAVVTGAALVLLAQGRAWVRPAEDPDVAAAVAEAAATAGVAVTVSPGPEGGADLLATVSALAGGRWDHARAAAGAAALAAALARDPYLSARCEGGVDVAVAPPTVAR